MAAALTLVGCGSSSASNVDAWLGNWMEGGTQSTTCAGVPVTTQLDNTVIITAGTKAGTIETNAESCTLVWDVSGDRATLESGQSCTVSSNGVSDTVSWTASTSTLNGNTITVMAGGSDINNCSFTQQGTLTKI